MFAFYTFLSSLYNLLKFILLIILLGEMQKFLGEVLKISGEEPPRTSPQNPALSLFVLRSHIMQDLSFEVGNESYCHRKNFLSSIVCK